MEYSDNSGHKFNLPDLLPCPCCGGKSEMVFIGNNWTKSRKVEIKCSKCFIKRTDATLRFSHEWVASKAIESWNARVKV